jgi:DNA repair exonuclease SbcCD ATPase subunit
VGLEEQVEARLTDSFAMRLREAIEKVRAEVYEQVISEAQSDPEVAGAKQILERIASMVASFGVPQEALKAIEEKDAEIAGLRDKLAERELEVKAAREEANEMSTLAREAAYTLRLEQKIAGHSSAETIRKLIGDVTQFTKVEDLDEKVEALLKEFANANEEDEETVEELRGRVADLEKELQGAKESVEQANKRTLEAIEVGEAAESMLHLERKLAGNPYADQVRTAAAQQGISSIEDAESLLESFTPQRRPDDDEAERIRAAIARGKQRSIEEDTHGDRGNGKGNGQVGSPLSEVGIELSEDEFDHLSGQGQRLNS